MRKSGATTKQDVLDGVPDSKEVAAAIEAAFVVAEKAGPKQYDSILTDELQKIWETYGLITLHMPCSVASGLGD